MKILLKLSIFVLLVFLTGCAAKIVPRIDQGGFLKPDDYVELQNAINHLPPHPTGYLGDLADKPWSPTWVYYAEKVNFQKFDSISIPDLKAQNLGDVSLLKEIPDTIKKELADKKLFDKIFRENPHGGLALVGSLTRKKDGSIAKSVLFMADENIIQVEFKIMEDDRQIGAIQAYALNNIPMGIAAGIARAIQGSLSSQIAERVAISFEGLRSGKYSNCAEGKQIEKDWILPATISK